MRSSSERASPISTNGLAVTAGRYGIHHVPNAEMQIGLRWTTHGKNSCKVSGAQTHTDRAERNRPQHENKEICIRQIG